MSTKKCSICGLEKPIEAFYKQATNRDGHMGRCIECTKESVRKYREENPTTVLKTRLKIFANKPTKQNARKVTEWAINAGVLIRPNQCTICGCSSDERRIEAHHYDYSKPLYVAWLCPKCHFEADLLRHAQEGGKEKPRTRQKQIVMIKDGTPLCKFDSIASAARAVEVSASSISSCLAGKTKTAAGCCWEYA